MPIDHCGVRQLAGAGSANWRVLSAPIGARQTCLGRPVSADRPRSVAHQVRAAPPGPTRPRRAHRSACRPRGRKGVDSECDGSRGARCTGSTRRMCRDARSAEPTDAVSVRPAGLSGSERRPQHAARTRRRDDAVLDFIRQRCDAATSRTRMGPPCPRPHTRWPGRPGDAGVWVVRRWAGRRTWIPSWWPVTGRSSPAPRPLGGLSVIDVPSREVALEWAGKIAVACRCPQRSVRSWPTRSSERRKIMTST